MHYERVLLATDLSANAAHAARFGGRLVAPGGRLRLAHVVDRPEGHGFMGTAMRERLSMLAVERKTRARQEIEEWAKGQDLPPHDVRLLEGSPKREIVAEAQEMQADLIVVGHHGRNALADKVLGSTAKAVLRHATCDVLVVPERDDHGSHLDRIALATDFYGPAEAAAHRAVVLSKVSGAQLIALHVVDDDLWRAVGYSPPVLEDGRPDPEWLDQTTQEMLHEFNERKLQGHAKEVVRRGRPATEAAKYVEEADVSLLVVGTHGAGMLERALIGSVAEDIVARSPRPVLVARAHAQPTSRNT